MNNSFNYHSFMNDIHGKVKSVLDAEYLHDRNCFLDSCFSTMPSASLAIHGWLWLVYR